MWLVYLWIHLTIQFQFASDSFLAYGITYPHFLSFFASAMTAYTEWHSTISCQTQKETKLFSTRVLEEKKSAQLSLWFRPWVTTLTVGQHAQASLPGRAMNDSELKTSIVHTPNFTKKTPQPGASWNTQKAETQIYLNCSF